MTSFLLLALFAITLCNPTSQPWSVQQPPWFDGLPLRQDSSASPYVSTDSTPPLLPTPVYEEPTTPSLLRKPIIVSYDQDNHLSADSPISDERPMIISPYQSQGVASTYYIVAVPKPDSFTPNVTNSFYPPPTTTVRPRTIVEVIQSIELPVDEMPYGSETSNILTGQHVNDKSEAEFENRKTKRSDESRSTSLFRAETVNGFRSLFKLPDPEVEQQNSTSLEESDLSLISGQNLTGPVIVTKNPINIFVQDPGLIYLMHKQFKYPMNGATQFQEGY